MPRGHNQHLQLLRVAQREYEEDEAMERAIEAHRKSSLEKLIEKAYPSVATGRRTTDRRRRTHQ